MLKKTFTYTDYNGVERTEDHYFNLNKAEILELEASTTGGLSEHIKRIVAAQDMPAIYNIFKTIVMMSYGVKSEDGKRFIKKDKNGYPLAEEFAQTEAFSDLIYELATNDKAAADFMNGIVPNQN
jgi:hypothetical protein